MSLMKVFDIAGAGMSAQSTRLNTTASNISNAETVASSADKAYRSRQPIFEAVQQQANSKYDNAAVAVKVKDIVESQAPIDRQFQPGHAMADSDGFIYLSNVNVMDEMANMVSASRSYQMNSRAIDVAKQMMLSTLRMGK